MLARRRDNPFARCPRSVVSMFSWPVVRQCSATRRMPVLIPEAYRELSDQLTGRMPIVAYETTGGDAGASGRSGSWRN